MSFTSSCGVGATGFFFFVCLFTFVGRACLTIHCPLDSVQVHAHVLYLYCQMFAELSWSCLWGPQEFSRFLPRKGGKRGKADTIGKILVLCAVCSLQCAVFSVQCIMCRIQYAVCSMQCAVCNVQYAIWIVQFVVCSVQCVVGSVLFTIYSVECGVWSVE